jgi:hypothetical protein
LQKPLAAELAGIKHRNFVDQDLSGWEKGNMIMILADDLLIRLFFAWKILLSIHFDINVIKKVLQKLKCY